jgi:hypothetical protein
MMRNSNHNSGSEIYIRADGKKVRRVRRTTNNESLRDLPVPMVGEIFLNAEGKRVRRVKRSPSTTIISSPQSTADASTIDKSLPSSSNVSPDLSKSLLNGATTGKPIVHLTDKEEAIATGYRKLKNMGLPDDAVWHKMTVSDVQPKIIAAVMGKEWNEPVAIGTLSQPRLLSSSAFGTTTTPTTLSSIQLTNDEEAVASVYRKMQKMDLPEDAVRHKMIVNDVAPKVVAAVLGALTGGEEAIAAVYRKLQKIDLSDDAIRHKMMASDIHPKIIAAVLGDEWTEEPPKEEQNLISVVVTVAIILTSEEEEVAAPFRKLTKIGLSTDTVRHQMIMCEVSPKIIAAVTGEEWLDDTPQDLKTEQNNPLTMDEDAVAVSYKRMLNSGVPKDLVRHKMVTATARPSDERRKALGDEIVLPTVSNFFPIERYYEAAEKVYVELQLTSSALQSAQSSDSQVETIWDENYNNVLDLCYVYGKRYCLFCIDAIPTHNYYGTPKYKALDSMHMVQLSKVFSILEDAANQMDIQEELRAQLRQQQQEELDRQVQIRLERWQEQIQQQKQSNNTNPTALDVQQSAMDKLKLLQQSSHPTSSRTSSSTRYHFVDDSSDSDTDSESLIVT